MNEDVATRLAAKVDQFKREIGYTRNLPVSEPYFHYADPRGDEYREFCPHADEPGCYVYAGKRGDILYVGKASRYLGNRIWSHLGRKAKAGEQQPFPDAKVWLKEHKPGVWVIPVPQEHWWLAPALEGHLIQEFKPPHNKRQR